MCLRPRAMWRSASGALKCSAPKYRLNSDPDLVVPCGKCEECLDARRKDWTRRIICESFEHGKSSFVTLTYSDDCLPADRLCSRKHIQDFIKRFRNVYRDFAIPLVDFKYFIVSEYGSKGGRPHYHGILFGVDFNESCWSPHLATLKDCHPIYTSDVLAKIWSHGFVSFDVVTPSSVSYVTKYALKNTEDNFKLFSRGLGKSYFFNDDNELTYAGTQAYDNGFIVLPSGKSGFVKSPVPKNIDRYIKLYDPMKWAEISHLRQDFAIRKTLDSRPLADRASIVKIHNKQELQKRKLDNEI